MEYSLNYNTKSDSKVTMKDTKAVGFTELPKPLKMEIGGGVLNEVTCNTSGVCGILLVVIGVVWVERVFEWTDSLVVSIVEVETTTDSDEDAIVDSTSVTGWLNCTVEELIVEVKSVECSKVETRAVVVTSDEYPLEVVLIETGMLELDSMA